MKKIAILGSTGSIGTQTLDVVRRFREEFQVTALAAGSNVELLAEQIREFHPSLVSVATGQDAARLRACLSYPDLSILCGMEGLLAVAAEPEAKMLVLAIVGMRGVRPAIAAIEAGKDIALANKETLVAAGHLIMPLAKRHDVKILPVDSEHSAIFQSSQGELKNGNGIDCIYLTASGGPFRGKTRDQLRKVTVAEALCNPNWVMGKKVTVDSATLVNKGLEMMEAHWLFDTAPDKIRVLIHPQSVIHSMVQFADGAVLAQLAVPDMHLPIQYALCYPKRQESGSACLDFTALSALTFEEPDTETFPGLRMAREAMDRGGNMPTVFNAANECAVSLFLESRIPFLAITDLIADAMAHSDFVRDPDVEDILETERMVHERIKHRW